MDCPPYPQQYNRDWDVQIKTAIGKIGKAAVGELEIRARSATENLLAKLPRADLTYIEQMMYAAYCSALRDNKALTEGDRQARIETYNREVRATFARREDSRPNSGHSGPQSLRQSIPPKDAAREELARKAVPYTPAAFVDSVAQRKSVIARLFIDAGIDLSALDGERATALMRAAYNGDKDLVEALLKAGADVNQRERDRQPAIVWAASNGHVDVVRQLLQHRKRRPDSQSLVDAVLWSADLGRPEALDVLLDQAADPRALASQAVSRAINGGRVRLPEAQMVTMIRALLRRGAHVNVVEDYGGWTPLTLAINQQLVELARFLVASGADLDARCICDSGEGGSSPLIVAARRAPDIVPILLQAGADKHARDKDGQTPLLAAAFNRHYDAVATLLAHGANPNDQVPNGFTALTSASGVGSLQAIGQLLAAGADVNARTTKGKTPLMFAAMYGGAAATRRLLDAGAVWHDRDADGKTALDLADSQLTGKDRSKVLELLRGAQPK